MVAKILSFFALVAAAAAVAIPVHAPIGKVVYAQPEAPAHYEFSYSVHDSHSGDVKQQQESRAGDVVHGSYSLVQPDGVHRIVEYTADDHHGFNANVRYEGTPVHPAPAKVAVAKIGYAPAPVAKIAYAPAPVAKIAYAAAPVAKVAYAPAQVNYAHAPAQISYAHAPAQVSYAHAPAQVSYAHAPAQVSYAHAPSHISYAHSPTQVSYAHAPAQVSYAHAPAQVTYAHAPVAKVAYAAAPVAKVAYAQNLGHVTFSSPAVSYHH